MGVLVKVLLWVCWWRYYDGCAGDGVTMGVLVKVLRWVCW